MMDSSREALKPDERGLGDAPAKSQGKLALALGVIAIALSLVFGFVYLISGARGGTAQPADGRFQPAGRARAGAITDVGSAGFASGCERAGSRSTARLGEAGSIENLNDPTLEQALVVPGIRTCYKDPSCSGNIKNGGEQQLRRHSRSLHL
jgi:hypothetical protein